MRPRFFVTRIEPSPGNIDPYFQVTDGEWKQYNYDSENACHIFFRTEIMASTVAELMNREWNQFQRNPK